MLGVGLLSLFPPLPLSPLPLDPPLPLIVTESHPVYLKQLFPPPRLLVRLLGKPPRLLARPRPPGALYAPRSASKLILHPAHYTRPEIHQLPRTSPAPQNPNGFIIVIIINFFFLSRGMRSRRACVQRTTSERSKSPLMSPSFQEIYTSFGFNTILIYFLATLWRGSRL